MTCGCGKEMEPGWLHAARPMIWSPREKYRLWIIPRSDEVTITDADIQRVDVEHPNPKAYICKACRRLAVEY